MWGVWCCALGQSFAAGDLPVRINKAFSLVYLFIDVCACFPLNELNSSGLENPKLSADLAKSALWIKAKCSDGDIAWVPLHAIHSALKHVRKAKGRNTGQLGKEENECGKERWMWNARGMVSRWSRLNEEWWKGKDCMLSFCVRVMEKCVVCQIHSLSPGWLQLWLCRRTDTWQDALCLVFYSCYLAKVSMLGWPVSLQTMLVIAVFDNWCPWTCATADGLCHAVWGMSVPAVFWSLKWDRQISEWQS